MLIIFGGLPGTGKSSIAKALAARLGAVYLRIDRIEQGLRESRAIAGDLADSGYRAAYGLAEDNLRLGHVVIADSVNPIAVTRAAWRAAAARAGSDFFEVEIFCSNRAEHRRRVETRPADIEGLATPDWAAVEARVYEPWTEATLRLDTASLSAETCVERIIAAATRP